VSARRFLDGVAAGKHVYEVLFFNLCLATSEGAPATRLPARNVCLFALSPHTACASHTLQPGCAAFSRSHVRSSLVNHPHLRTLVCILRSANTVPSHWSSAVNKRKATASPVPPRPALDQRRALLPPSTGVEALLPPRPASGSLPSSTSVELSYLDRRRALLPPSSTSVELSSPPRQESKLSSLLDQRRDLFPPTTSVELSYLDRRRALLPPSSTSVELSSPPRQESKAAASYIRLWCAQPRKVSIDYEFTEWSESCASALPMLVNLETSQLRAVTRTVESGRYVFN
jgi:hypothetical protein